MAVSRRAVILDKDGTLVENVPYNVEPALIRLTPGAGEALRLLRDAGYALMVASNQSGVARGYFTEAALEAVQHRIAALLEAEGVRIEAFYWCPHHPQARLPHLRRECGCRKPAPGLLLRAAEVAGIDPADCWMVGDILDDIEAGHRASMRAVLIDHGNETEWLSGPQREPDFVAAGLREAARAIVAADAGMDRAAGYARLHDGEVIHADYLAGQTHVGTSSAATVREVLR